MLDTVTELIANCPPDVEIEVLRRASWLERRQAVPLQEYTKFYQGELATVPVVVDEVLGGWILEGAIRSIHRVADEISSSSVNLLLTSDRRIGKPLVPEGVSTLTYGLMPGDNLLSLGSMLRKGNRETFSGGDHLSGLSVEQLLPDPFATSLEPLLEHPKDLVISMRYRLLRPE